MNLTRQEIVIPALTFFSVITIGSSILLLLQMRRRKTLETKLRDVTWTDTDKIPSVKKTVFLHLLERFGNLVSHGQASTSLLEQLVRAGYLSRNAPALYTGIKLFLFMGGLIATAIFIAAMKASIPTKALLVSLGGAVPFFIPNIVLLLQEKKRRDEICQHLPEAIDLLEICVSSGIGLEMAWNMVSDEIQDVSPVLASAMALTNFEIHLGASRTEAMRHMSARTGAQALSSLAAILIQTDRFGTSVASALKEFAASMRDDRRFTAEESAEKLPIKMIIPMVLFIFPAVALVVVAPAAINIAKVILSR